MAKLFDEQCRVCKTPTAESARQHEADKHNNKQRQRQQCSLRYFWVVGHNGLQHHRDVHGGSWAARVWVKFVWWRDVRHSSSLPGAGGGVGRGAGVAGSGGEGGGGGGCGW